MSRSKIGVILSTTRPGRFGEKAANWVLEATSGIEDMELELIDLRNYPMPFFNEEKAPVYTKPAEEAAQPWLAKLDELDGYIFVVAEYNRSIPGVLKNAIDYAYRELNGKPAGFVGYGATGAARAVEHLRLICIELQMVPTRNGVHLSGTDFFNVAQGKNAFSDFPHIPRGMSAMMDELARLCGMLTAARSARG